jgi:4-amino-4-deoxy-L-arabinose transferase-like glycosyltransferase
MMNNKYSLALLGAVVATMLCVGLFARSYWRPDEPREAALIHSMAANPSLPLPTLLDRQFAEKPPFMYWIASKSQLALGSSPSATRLPQLLYGLMALLAITSLANAMAGRSMALISGLLFATFTLAFQTQIWLACDALLVAGVSVSLLGMYKALHADTSSLRMRWYLLMHAGLTIAFAAKNLAAWLVPVTALLSFLLWERRWRDLLRWELWIGAVIPVAFIGSWVLHLAAQVDGPQLLRVLFWNNLVGRAVSVSSEVRYAYAAGHQMWPGKYFIEMPFYVFPWFLVAFGAFRLAWQQVRVSGSQRSDWRFAVCASLPGLLLLSVVATGRGIYATPSLIGVALLIGLWSSAESANTEPLARKLLKGTAYMVCALSAALLALTLLLAVASGHLSIGTAVSVVACACCLLVACTTARRNTPARAETLFRLGVAYAVLVSLGALGLFAAINRSQDLSALAADTKTALGQHPLVLWHPDETTLAWVALYLPAIETHVIYADDAQQDDLPALAQQLKSQPGTRVLTKAPRSRWNASMWIRFLHDNRVAAEPARSTEIEQMQAQLGLQVYFTVAQAGGRGYALLKD